MELSQVTGSRLNIKDHQSRWSLTLIENEKVEHIGEWNIHKLESLRFLIMVLNLFISSPLYADHTLMAN